MQTLAGRLSAQSSTATPMTSAAAEALLARLEDILKEENAKLEVNEPYDPAAFIPRKHQVLRDLMVLQRAEDCKSVVKALAPRFSSLRKTVDRNHQLLKSQVQAMTDITNLLTEVALAESADGTYTRQRVET